MDIISLEYTDVFDENNIKQLIFSKNLIKSEFNEKSLFPIIVDGKSMEPIINDKSVVVADLSLKKLFDNKIYIIYYEEKMWVKKYESKNKVFISINPQFSHLIYREGDVHVVAQVLITFTNL